MKKLLFYSHDSYGLGNIRRMVAIATYLVEKHDDVSVLLITGSPMLHAFRTHPQIDFVKLPCLQRNQTGQYQTTLSALDVESLLGCRSRLISEIVASYQPHLLLVDKKPTGLGGELTLALTQLGERRNTRVKLLLRDILDCPTVTHSIWTNNRYFDAIEQYYDQVLVVGEKAVFDLPNEYQFPKTIADKTHFCGYLKRQSEVRHRPKASIDEKKKVLVSVGGGNDGMQVLKAYLIAMRTKLCHHSIHSSLFYGPEMSEDDVKQLKHLASGLEDLRLMEFTDDFMSYLNAADVIVSMAGYNTVCEALSLGVPMLAIPRVEPVSEQLIRARKLAALPLFEYIHPNHLTPEILMDKLDDLLQKSTFNRDACELDMRGMENIEHWLIT